jgi:lysophospholipase L1-like esterase
VERCSLADAKFGVAAFLRRGRSVFLALIGCAPLVGWTQPAWIATWTASPEAADADPDEPLMNLHNQTVRERARVTLGGAQIRLRFSNEFGTAPLLLGRVSVALAQGAEAIVGGSLRPVTFAGAASTRIVAGAPVLSDPITLPVKDGAEISISIYVPQSASGLTWHALAMKDAVISGEGDHTQDATLQAKARSQSSVLLSAVLVPATLHHRVIVAFGDSIVDGDGATPEGDHNWPAELFRHLGQKGRGAAVAVVNAGIAGNRLMGPGPVASFGAAGLARFGRDALSMPGVTHVLLLEGGNDIGFPGASLHGLTFPPAAEEPSADDLIGAYRQLIARAHVRGVKVIGATLTPCEGVPIAGYHTAAKEQLRQAVNHWIRTSGAFDGVVDFDAVVRDPQNPQRLQPRLASPDHLHPNDLGYRLMAEAVDLSLFG